MPLSCWFVLIKLWHCSKPRGCTYSSLMSVPICVTFGCWSQCLSSTAHSCPVWQHVDVLGMSSGKHNAMVQRLSIYLSRRHTYCDSPGGSMQHGQCTFWSNNKEDWHICFILCCTCQR